MPPSLVIHSLDIVVDRTDQALLTDSLSGILSLELQIS